MGLFSAARSLGLAVIVVGAGVLFGAAASANAQDFVKASGRQLVLGSSGQPICLRGQGFATDLLRDPADPSAAWQRNSPNDSWLPVTTWYSQSDVQSIAGIGFNVMRVSLNYRLFEDDTLPCTCNLQNSECSSIFSFPAGDPCNYVNSVWSLDPQYISGWDYLDTWIQWANNHGVYIILDMHTPPGGLQLSPQGVTLWTDPQNGDRLKRLWRAIAKRYANEPRIAAYDILNEPTPAEANPQLSTAGLWQNLAGEIVSEIRKEDANHLVILERVIAITDDAFNFAFDDFTQPMANSWFLLADTNVMYDFHYYWPMINHQANWGMCGGGSDYPLPGVFEETFLGAPLVSCDKSALEAHFSAFNAFGVANNVATSVTEWGGAVSGGDIFGNSGGLGYIADMLDIFERHSVNWTFFYANILHQGSDQLQPFDAGRTSIFSDYFQVASCGGGAPAPACASTPVTGCDVAGKASITLGDNVSNDRRDNLRFHFSRGSLAREVSALGDPRSRESYRLCIYDQDLLVDEVDLAPDPVLWTAVGGRGFRYRDRFASHSGIRKVILKAGRLGAAKPATAVWVGKGPGLPDPALPMSTPVDVTVQIVASNDTCLSVTFDSAARNSVNAGGDLRVFKARRR